VRGLALGEVGGRLKMAEGGSSGWRLREEKTRVTAVFGVHWKG